MKDLMFDRLQDESLSPRPEHAPVDPDPRLSRRRLLGGAAGGFVLAASGLLVPEGVAAQPPLEGSLPAPPVDPLEWLLNEPRERKRKNRNRKDRNDKDRNDKDRQETKGGFDLLDVELNFYSGYTLTHEAEVWEINYNTKPWTWRLRWPKRTVPPVRQLVKSTGSTNELVMVVLTAPATGPLSFKVRNVAFRPTLLTVFQTTWDRDGALDPKAHQFVSNLEVIEGQQVRVPGFYVDRSPDSKYHKIFYVNADD